MAEQGRARRFADGLEQAEDGQDLRVGERERAAVEPQQGLDVGRLARVRWMQAEEGEEQVGERVPHSCVLIGQGIELRVLHNALKELVDDEGLWSCQLVPCGCQIPGIWLTLRGAAWTSARAKSSTEASPRRCCGITVRIVSTW